MGDCRCFTQHCARATVLFLCQIDRSLYFLLLKGMTRENMLNRNLHKRLRVFFDTNSMYTDFICRHILTLFPQNSNYIHASTTGQSHQEHLHWAWPCVLPSVMFGGIEYDMVSRTCFNVEAHSAF